MPALTVRSYWLACALTPGSCPRLISMLLLSVLPLLSAGCSRSDQRKPVFPVKGQVLFEGKPTPHALVVFHPLNAVDKDAVRPQGRVNPDGTFTLTTYEPGDGAPAGEYRVTVELWLSSGKDDTGPTNRLPPQYANPTTSGLTATVGTGPTELRPFQLKR